MASKNSNVLMMEDDNVDLTPMIDIVFLLLIYFMVTLSLVQQEADLSIQLPAQTEGEATDSLPSMQEIEILPDGTVLLNGAPMDDANQRDMPQLTYTLSRLKQSSDRANVPTVVTIFAHSDSPHQRSIDVLNACAGANIRMLSFGDS